MQFVTPAALWLLGLCLLPLLLSRRRPAVRHAVSNLYLWREAARRAHGQVAPRRLHLTTLALVQMATIAAMVLCLAGLVVSCGGGRIALVLDLSASMAARDGDTARLDTARARIRSVLGTLPRFARVRLILATASPRDAGEWAATDPRLFTAIDALDPTAGTADIQGAIDLAAAAGDVSSIVVLSDVSVASATGATAGPAVQWLRVGRAAENAAVTRVATRRTELGGRAGEVLVGLRNYGRTPRDGDVEIDIDGRTVHRVRVQLSPGGSETLNVGLDDLGQFVTARLVGRDALSIDDSRSIALAPVHAIRVALGGRRGSFLERALAVNPSVSLRTSDEPGRLPDVSTAGDVEVLICDRCGSSTAGFPSLVVSDRTAERTHGVVRVVATGHPLADSIDPGETRATADAGAGTGLFVGRGLQPPPSPHTDAEVVLRVGSAAAVTAFDVGGLRRVDVHLDLTEPDFVLSPAFPVLIANAVAWLAAGRAMPLEVTAGEPIAFALPGTASDDVRVIGPDGRTRDLRRAGAQVVVAGTEMAGRYRVLVNASERLVAVNPDVVAESDLSAPLPASLDRTEAGASSVRAPTALGTWLALLALALLGLEWWLRVQGA